jgi:succinoglycan biosynthesis protein ExoU
VQTALAEPETRQVVVVDDGSSDGTAAAARSAAQASDRLLLHRLEACGGPAAARNLAIALSDAPWIAPLDADDYFQPGRLGRLLDQSEGCDLVADDLLMVHEGALQEAPRCVIGEREPLPLMLGFAAFVEGNISRPGRRRREYGFLKPLMRRAFLAQHGLAYDERLRLGEDFILYSRALACGGRFKVTPPCGYVAVERAGSLSGRHETRDLQALRDASVELTALPGLTAAERLAARRHERFVQAKVDLREVIDARRSGGLVRGLLAIAARSENAGYIFARMAEDKWSALSARRAAAPQA